MVRVCRSVGSGRPVVLVHSALSDGSQWDDLIEHAPAGVRAIAVDLPDFGFDAPGTTLQSLEEGLAALVDELGEHEPVTLVGHSFGGWLVGRVLSSRQERIDRALIVAGPPYLTPEIRDAYVRLAAALEAGQVVWNEQLEQIVAGALGREATPEHAGRLVEIARRCPMDRLVRSLRLVADLGRDDARVQPFTTPTRILHGRRDASVPLSLGRAFAELGTCTSLEIWETESHVLPLTHTRQVADLVFAQSGPAGASSARASSTRVPTPSRS